MWVPHVIDTSMAYMKLLNIAMAYKELPLGIIPLYSKYRDRVCSPSL
jgi:hypothetical protein